MMMMTETLSVDWNSQYCQTATVSTLINKFNAILILSNKYLNPLKISKLIKNSYNKLIHRE